MSPTYEREVELPVSASEAFAWHGREGALERLIPPFERVEVASREGGIEDGARVELVNRLGPLKLKWVAEHCDYEPGVQFRDVQVTGPFRSWRHTHRFVPADAPDGSGGARSVLEDEVEYRLPGGAVGAWFADGYVRRRVDAMFDYRHRTTRDDLAAHARFRERGTRRVAVTGASGLIGSALVPMLTTGGHRVVRMSRRKASGGSADWDPARGEVNQESLAGVDAVVHLAGENIAARRWSAAQKRNIVESRVEGTRVLAEAIAEMDPKPEVFVCASAIGYYGDRGDASVDEASGVGEGFLPEVAEAWESACAAAEAAGIRVVKLRYGVVLSPRGGALAAMMLPFRYGVGGRLGSGSQYWSWVSIDDAVGATHQAIMDERLEGAVNVVAPNAVRNVEFTKALARVLRRPAAMPMPQWAARMALGEMADELLLASMRVVPGRLQARGYTFRQPELEDALRHVLGRPGPTGS